MFGIWEKKHWSCSYFLYSKENKKYLNFLKQPDYENIEEKLISYKRALFFEYFFCIDLKALLGDLENAAENQHPTKAKMAAKLKKLSDLPRFVKSLELGEHFEECERLWFDSNHSDERPFTYCLMLIGEKIEKMLLMHNDVFKMVNELKLDGAQKKLLDDFVRCEVDLLKLLDNLDDLDAKEGYEQNKSLYNKLFYFYKTFAGLATN